MKLNWKVRVKNKGFWLALIPAALLLVQAVGQVFGLALELSALGDQLLGGWSTPCSPCWPSWGWSTTPPPRGFPTAARP